MSDINWTLTHSRVAPHADAVSAIGLSVAYPGRACELDIFLQPPLIGQTPQTEAVMAEFRRLRDALNDILGEQ